MKCMRCCPYCGEPCQLERGHEHECYDGDHRWTPHEKECHCPVCTAAKKLGYRNVSPFEEQPVLVRKDVESKTKVYRNKAGYIVIEF